MNVGTNRRGNRARWSRLLLTQRYGPSDRVNASRSGRNVGSIGYARCVKKPVGWRTVTGHAPTILVSSSLWMNWARIAIEHEGEAQQGRADWQERQDLRPEFQASLTAVTAAAFALEALHGTLAPLLDRDPSPDRKPWPYMRETYAMACRPSAKWQDEFAWLFGTARPRAVHFIPKQHEPIYHEGLKTSIAEENHLFCAESTTRAVDLMMDVFGALFAPGPNKERGIDDWSRQTAHVLDDLTALRATGR
jgi:hypothetical protein